MACGLIPLVKRGGGGTENYVEGFGFYYDTFEELKSEILNFKNNYDIFIDAKNNMINYTYSNAEMCEQYWNVIKEME
jgi:glycosyltransferase involved in cell wall biosynthesis